MWLSPFLAKGAIEQGFERSVFFNLAFDLLQGKGWTFKAVWGLEGEQQIVS